MLTRMPVRIYEEWARFYAEEPFGESPLRLGFAAANLGNLLGTRKDHRSWGPGDFMPYGAPSSGGRAAPARTPGKTADQQVAHLVHVSRQMGWTVVDKRGEKKGKRANDD